MGIHPAKMWTHIVGVLEDTLLKLVSILWGTGQGAWDFNQGMVDKCEFLRNILNW